MINIVERKAIIVLIFRPPAPVIIRPSENGTDIGGKLEPGEGINCKIQVPKQGATVKVGYDL